MSLDESVVQEPVDAASEPVPVADAEPAEKTVTGSYVDIAVETYVTWVCADTKCGARAKSIDPKLIAALAKGEAPLIACPTCKHQHLIKKRPERLVKTAGEVAAEQRKPGFRPALSPAANRLLGNVRR